MENMTKKLFIFEIANNYDGSFERAIEIVEKFKHFPKEFPEFDFAFKFQFRDIDTFIHPSYKDKEYIKYVKRFKESKLTETEFGLLKSKVEECGFMSICTGFDEVSVDLIQKMNFNYIKIASCSFTDWPLLNKIANFTDLPIIASCGGSSLKDIDNVVSFFLNRNKNFSLMHCVGEYPTELKNLQLNQIKFLKERYPNLRIGYSTHEHPTEKTSIVSAISMGADIFEKHVNAISEKYVMGALNSYSCLPEQINDWLLEARKTMLMLGVSDKRCPSSEKEQESLRAFKRGAYLNKNIEKDGKITRNDLYFAFPNENGQVLANDMSKYAKIIAKENLGKDQPLKFENIEFLNERDEIYALVQKVKKVIKNSKIVIPAGSELELSFHYGVDDFENFGLSLITVVNREYCKKFLISLPGQFHPEQYHKLKEETFSVLYGKLELYLNSSLHKLSSGAIVTIAPGIRHSFRAGKEGAIIEEISSTHYKEDSFYSDENINNNPNRKTIIRYW
jgi:sialic acid synthase SpsE